MDNHIPTQKANQLVNEAKLGLEEILRQGARQMLQQAIENEVSEYIDKHTHLLDEAGQRLVVRNGSMPERELLTGIGKVPVCRPRVHDRRPGAGFTSRMLPPYMRRIPSMDALIPALYLRGISTGDFSEALEAILGPQAKGLSPTNIVRLKEVWKQEYEQWRKRDLKEKHYVYVWADGIYFNVRLEEDRTCILVLIGATADGRKELLAVHDGYRESKLSWLELLRELKSLGGNRPLWLLGMAAWDSGRRFGKNSRRPESSDAGCIRPPISSTSCPSACSRRPNREFMICTLRRRRTKPWTLIMNSCTSTRPNIPKPAHVCVKTRTYCSLSMIFLPSTGFIFAQQIRSSPRSLRFVIERNAPRDVVHERRH